MKIEVTPRGLLTAFFRQQTKFFLAFLFLLYGALAYIYLATPMYQSSGTILVKFGNNARPDVSLSEHTPNDVPASEGQEIIESYLQILQSHDLLAQLVDEYGAEQLYPALTRHPMTHADEVEYAIHRLAKDDLTIKNTKPSDIIEVTLLNQNPRIPAPFIHRLLQLFIQRQTEMYNKPQTDFISNQVKRGAQQLAEDQQKLQDFKNQNGISSIEEELTQRLQERSDAQNGALENINEARTKVEELKFHENELLATYREDSVAVKQVRSSLALAEQSLRAREEDLKAATSLGYGTSRAQEAGLQPAAIPASAGAAVASNALASHIADINARIAELEAKRNQFNDLTRQLQISEESYRSYVRKFEEAQANETLNQQNITRISILDEPAVPLKPAKPNKLLIMLLSLIGALLFGLGVAAAAEMLDTRFSKPEQLSALLGVPVMATFGELKKKRLSGRYS